MKLVDNIMSGLSLVKRYHYKWVIFLATAWTIIDVVYWVRYMQLGYGVKDGIYIFSSVNAVILRAIIVFLMSILIVNQLIFRLRETFRNKPTIIYLGVRTIMLILGAFVMNFLLHVTYSALILHKSWLVSLQHFYEHVSSSLWLIEHSIGWIVLFIFSHLLIEINEKYSPGIFFQILVGKYIQPRIETRIVMFIDMTDSTTIAEQLGSKTYFMFIRDFIYFLSVSLLEYDGRIYQYVGDEIVVSWPYSLRNTRKCIGALVHAKRLLQRNERYFKRKYGVVPDFKAGIHYGEVTIGEIGIIKKDLVMSGDTMNTTARIRTSCTDYNRNYIISKDFMDKAIVNHRVEPLGEAELKGKNTMVELYALII
jgi:adenylate cyclase